MAEAAAGFSAGVSGATAPVGRVVHVGQSVIHVDLGSSDDGGTPEKRLKSMLDCTAQSDMVADRKVREPRQAEGPDSDRREDRGGLQGRRDSRDPGSGSCAPGARGADAGGGPSGAKGPDPDRREVQSEGSRTRLEQQLLGMKTEVEKRAAQSFGRAVAARRLSASRADSGASRADSGASRADSGSGP